MVEKTGNMRTEKPPGQSNEYYLNIEDIIIGVTTEICQTILT